MKEKVIIFGVGKNYQLYKTQINDNFRILAIVDNDINIQNTEVDGYIVISADQLQEFEYDLILVTEVAITCQTLLNVALLYQSRQVKGRYYKMNMIKEINSRTNYI